MATIATKRLNLNNSIDKKLSGTSKNSDKFFHPLVATAHKRYDRKGPRSLSTVDSSVNRIVNSVHSKLRTRNNAKIVRAATLRTPPQLPVAVIDAKGPPVKQVVVNVPNKNAKAISLRASPPPPVELKRKNTIPQLKATWQQKYMQRMRRGVPAHGQDTTLNTYSSQHRIREVLRQKRILEDMILEHQKLQLDRQAIAVEVQQMKSYLNEIREKLDFSLKKLNSKSSGARKTIAPITSGPGIQKKFIPTNRNTAQSAKTTKSSASSAPRAKK